MATKAEQEIQAEAIERLREMIKPGDTVHTILRHVSASGMTRSISLVIPREGGIYDCTYWAARATGDKIDQSHGGIKAGGVGMDMGFHLVYGLSRTLFRDGFKCIGERCPSNDHSNGMPRTHYAGTWDDAPTHSDPGYALRQMWL